MFHRYRKAVSPVIAVMLLIALTIAAVAIVWSVVDTNTDLQPSIRYTQPIFSTSHQINDTYNSAGFLVSNTGLVDIQPRGLQITSEITDLDVYWEFTTTQTLKPGVSKIMEVEAGETEDLILHNQRVNTSITYFDTTNEDLIDFSTHKNIWLPQVLVADSDLYSKLVYRTSAEDASTSRSSFPVDAGYSPTLYFLLGVYASGTISSDFILQEHNVESMQYYPYINDTTEFTTGDPIESVYRYSPYNDTGNYPGLVSLYGTTFDPADPISWKGRGMVQAAFYIHNPTNDPMDVEIYYQGDDNVAIYNNTDPIASGVPNWRTWTSTGVPYTIYPGTNFFLLRSQDTGGAWNFQVLFSDIGDTDDLSLLESKWPVKAPNLASTEKDPERLRFRNTPDDSGTSLPSFPGEGYAPKKWFLLGKFLSGSRPNTAAMDFDYLEASGHANESTYRPWVGSGHTFSGSNLDNKSGYEFMAYEDAGNHYGLIDFVGGSSSRFDRGDTLFWEQRGIVYAGSYILNPTDDPVDVSIAVQSDDYSRLWVNGEYQEAHAQSNPRWNQWGDLNNVTLNPGLNYILIKSGDGGGNWNINIIMFTADGDDLSYMTSVWPESTPSGILGAPASVEVAESNIFTIHKETLALAVINPKPYN